MAIRIRKHGSVIASFATPQEIVIDHANDDIRIGDGTDLFGPLQNVGGVLCFPIRIMGDNAGLATNAVLTGGTVRSKVTDGVDNVGIETVGADKALKVAVISTVGGGAAPSHTDDSAFTVGTHQITAIGGIYRSVSDNVDDNDAGALAMTQDRRLMIQIDKILAGLALPVTDNGSTLSIDDGGGAITVDGTVAVTNANLDAALSTLATHAKQDTMITSLQLLDDMIATIAAAVPTKASFVAGTDGTNARALKTDASGELQVDVLTLPAIPAGTNNIGDVDILSIAAGDNNIGNVDIVTMPDATVVGKAAHDAATSGNPVLVGFQARTTALPTAVSTAADAANSISDEYGRQLHAGFFAPQMIGYQAPSAITNTTETTIVTADANNCLDIISLIITNNSDVQSIATLKDSTAGTTRAIFLVPARGGIVHNPNTPMPQATKNNNWTLTMTTTATSTNVSVMFGKRPT